MSSIPVLTTNVKTAAHPPSSKARKPRKHAEWNVKALPFAATHIDAPTLPEMQQAAMGLFARILLADALQQLGVVMTGNMTFDDLYAQHFQSNVHFVQFCYGLSHEDAEDIVQIALIRIWDEYPTLQLTSPVGYLRGRVKYVVAHYLSQRHHSASLDAPLSHDIDETLLDYHNFTPLAPTLEDQALAHLQLDQVNHQMRTWPVFDQVVFRMHVLGYTYQEIHAHLVQRYQYSGSVQGVERHLQKARLQVRGQRQQQKVLRKGPRLLVQGSWSLVAASCLRCGTTERKHMAKGLCGTCYERQRLQNLRVQVTRPMAQQVQGWSRRHAACVGCGTVERKHLGQGYCSACYASQRRAVQRNHAPVKPRHRRIVALLK